MTRLRPSRRGVALALAGPSLLAALLALLACASSAPPPQPAEAEKETKAEEERPDVVLRTERDDTRAGEKASEEVSSTLGLVDDPELTAYVDAIGQRLARNAPRGSFDYHFAIVDQDAPNAFALPGGFIYVSRGLLALANDEDELANVLAHEVIHVAQRHAAARQQVVENVPGLFQWLQMRSLAAYGRSQERVADRLGQGLAAVSGWDPAGLARFLRQLEFSERLQLGASRLPSFLDTHPGTRERAAEAAQRARMIRWQRRPGVASDRADFLRRIEGIAVGTSASEGVFQGTRFLHADLGFTLRFPDGWDVRNTRKAVGAIAPTRDAQIFLELDEKGDDPEKAARAYIDKSRSQGLRVSRLEPAVIGGSRAVRAWGHASTPAGGVHVVITWIARRGLVYRLTGLALKERYEPVFLNVARSFRNLTPELAESITETRLHIAEAQGGESLRELSSRTGNQWDVQRTAVMNGMFTSDTPSPGQLVKVAVVQSYQPAAAGASTP